MPFVRIPRPQAVVALGMLGALLWSGHADAFCREVTGTPPAGYDPADAGCFNGVDDAGKPFVPLYWRNQCVSYSLQKNASDRWSRSPTRAASHARPSTPGPTLRVIADAGGPSITEYEYGPPIDCDEAPSNEHNNPIIFRDDTWPYDSVNALGFTTLTVDLDTGEIYGAAIEINSSTNGIVAEVDGSIPNGFYDLAKHLDPRSGPLSRAGPLRPSRAPSCMPTITAGQSVLTPDDVSGICSIYPPDMTRDTAEGKVGSVLCNATPAARLLDLVRHARRRGIRHRLGRSPAGRRRRSSLHTPALAPWPWPGPWRRGSRDRRRSWLSAVLARRSGPRVHARPEGAIGRLTRRMRGGAAAVGITAAFFALTAREARASVAIAVLFDELVQKATAVAVVTPVEQRGVVEDGRIVTYTHVRVDRRVAGPIAGDLWLRALGGAVGRIGQIVQGQPTLRPRPARAAYSCDPMRAQPRRAFGLVVRHRGGAGGVSDREERGAGAACDRERRRGARVPGARAGRPSVCPRRARRPSARGGGPPDHSRVDAAARPLTPPVTCRGIRRQPRRQRCRSSRWPARAPSRLHVSTTPTPETSPAKTSNGADVPLHGPP